MRLGIVTQAYYPVLGGVTEHVWHLGRELERRGHEVTVITGNAKVADDRGLRVIRLGFQVPVMSNGANNSVTLGWKLGRHLQQIEQQEKFDVIHVHSALDPGLPLIASKAMRTPKVGTYHSYRNPGKTFYDKVPDLFRPVFEDAIAKIQAHIAVSPAAAAYAHRYFPQVAMTIIPNGIDAERFNPRVEPAPIRRGDEFLILYVGRMDPRKGAKFLFGALPDLERAIPNYRLIVVGTGWMKQYYDAHIPLTLHKRVEFVGYVTPEDLPKYYRAADVYCSPATGNESFGIVLAEAMASGTAVVASDIDGYRTVITSGIQGLLVPPRDSAKLAAAIIELYKNPDQRRAMGLAGIQRAGDFAWPKVTDRVEAVYRQVKK